MGKTSKLVFCAETPANPAEQPPGKASQDARHRIYQAAFRQFGTRGYSCTSIQDIADAAAVKKSILYYYFSNKEDLYQALLVESATHLGQLLRQGLLDAGLSVEKLSARRLGKKGAETALGILAETILSLARENRDSVRFFLSHMFAVDSDRPPCSTLAIEQGPLTLITAAIEAGMTGSELSGKTQLLAALILGGIQVSVIRHLRNPSDEPLPLGYGRALVRAALDGFRPVGKGLETTKTISPGKDRPPKRFRRA